MADFERELTAIVDREKLIEKIRALPADTKMLVIFTYNNPENDQTEFLDEYVSGDVSLTNSLWMLARTERMIHKIADISARRNHDNASGGSGGGDPEC